MRNRRQFIQIVPFAGAALCSAGFAQAQANLLNEKDAAAANLGYVADAAKADRAKYKNWAAGQTCANCALFQGKAGDAAAACPLFAGKVVSSKGWCSAYAKKAA
jgi:hypothetical protein